jgi:hypothetical protein
VQKSQFWPQATLWLEEFCHISTKWQDGGETRYPISLTKLFWLNLGSASTRANSRLGIPGYRYTTLQSSVIRGLELTTQIENATQNAIARSRQVQSPLARRPLKYNHE